MTTCLLAVALCLGLAPQDRLDVLVARLAEDGAWWTARDELCERAADGERLAVLRALHEAWLTSADAELRRRNELVRAEVDRAWSRVERQAELERRADDLDAALAALEVGDAGGAPDWARVREARDALRRALVTTPHAVASQGLLPDGPPGPDPAPRRAEHADGEVVPVTGSDGRVHEARWEDGRLLLEVDGIDVVLITAEEQAAPEYGSHASERLARRGPPPPFTESARVAAVARGLEYLAATQGEDGGWPAPPLGTHDRMFDSAVAGLALLATGDTVERGEHREAIRRVRDFLLARLPEEGPPRVDEPGRERWEDFETWYLAFAGMFLAQCSDDPDGPTRAGLERVRRRLGRLARRTGGWHHDHDFRLVQSGSFVYAHYSEDLLVVSSFVVPVVFDAAPPPPGADRRATRGYYARLQNEDGGFAYGNHHGWAPSHASEAGRTAGALLALRHLGMADTPAYRQAREYLRANLDEVATSRTHGGSLFPINYLSGALGTLPDPELWPLFRERIFDELLAAQGEDGAFVLDTGPWDTPAMGTGIATIVLLLEEGHLEQLAAR